MQIDKFVSAEMVPSIDRQVVIRGLTLFARDCDSDIAVADMLHVEEGWFPASLSTEHHVVRCKSAYHAPREYEHEQERNRVLRKPLAKAARRIQNKRRLVARLAQQKRDQEFYSLPGAGQGTKQSAAGKQQREFQLQWRAEIDRMTAANPEVDTATIHTQAYLACKKRRIEHA